MRNRRIQPSSRLDARADARRAGTPRGDRRARRRRRRLRLPRARATPTRRSSSSARRPRSSSSGSPCPRRANQLLVHVRDYTKGHPSIAANNHPVRHGPVVGIHNGIIINDDELLAHHSCARAEPQMTVDSEAIFAVAAHSRNDARALEACTARWRPPGSTSASPASLFLARGSRPPAVARRGPRRRLLRLDRGARSRSSSATAACELRKREVREGTLLALARRRGRPPRALPARLDYVEDDPLPAGAGAAASASSACAGSRRSPPL